MAPLVVLILVFGELAEKLFNSVFEGNEVFSGSAAMLGMIIALLSAIFFQLNLMHQDKE